MNLGGYSSAPDASLSRWFATILGASTGIAGLSGSRDSATVKVDTRLVTPALRTLDALLTQGLLDCMMMVPAAEATPAGAPRPAAAAPPAPSFGMELAALTVRRLGTAPDDVQRTLAGSAVLLGLLPFPGGVRVASTLALLDLLAHGFPRVRRAVAEALYTRLLALDAAAWAAGAEVGAGLPTGCDDLPASPSPPDLDAAVALLAEAEWDAPPAHVLPPRDRLYGLLLGLPQAPAGRSQCGVAEAAAAAAGGGAHAGAAFDDEHAAGGYAALVRDAGY